MKLPIILVGVSGKSHRGYGLYNYNAMNPININYRNHQGPKPLRDDKNAPINPDEESSNKQFPNGNKVQIDYKKNKVNIAQVVEDFKSTILAINAPAEVVDEVSMYLNMVEVESKKGIPSRDIILSNLKNASKISDKYIEKSLNKPSKVVEDWIDALFLQNVELKNNPSEINEAFRVNLPKKGSQNTQGVTGQAASVGEQQSAPLPTSYIPANQAVQGYQNTQAQISPNIVQNSNSYIPSAQALQGYQNTQTQAPASPIKNSPLNEDTYHFAPQSHVAKSVAPQPFGSLSQFADDTFGVEQNQPVQAPLVQDVYQTNPKLLEEQLNSAQSMQVVSKVVPEARQISTNQIYKIESKIEAVAENVSISPLENRVKNTILQGKKVDDPYQALKLYDEALKLVKDSGNKDLEAAIYFERGKIFDTYDYAEYALNDYNKASQTKNHNLKTHAHIGMGRIYDDYAKFDPALEQFSLAIESSEVAQNPQGKTKALRHIATMFADRFDKDNLETFSELAVDAAYETKNPKIVSKTYSDVARNYEYIGENNKALDSYKQAAVVVSKNPDYKLLADNYEDAAALMEKIGNKAKATSLMEKSKMFREKVSA